MPVVILTELEDRSASEQAVQRQTERQTREARFELTQQREGEAIRGDELSFEHLVIIGGLSVLGAGQTMRAMALGETVAARAVKGDDIILLEQAIAFEHFFAEQNLDQSGEALLGLQRIEVFESVIERVAVRRVRAAKQSREVGGGGGIIAEFQGRLGGARPNDKGTSKCR